MRSPEMLMPDGAVFPVVGATTTIPAPGTTKAVEAAGADVSMPRVKQPGCAALAVGGAVRGQPPPELIGYVAAVASGTRSASSRTAAANCLAVSARDLGSRHWGCALCTTSDARRSAAV